MPCLLVSVAHKMGVPLYIISCNVVYSLDYSTLQNSWMILWLLSYLVTSCAKETWLVNHRQSCAAALAVWSHSFMMGRQNSHLEEWGERWVQKPFLQCLEEADRAMHYIWWGWIAWPKTAASMWKRRQIANLYHKSIFSDHLSWHPLGFGLNFYKKYSLIIFSLACVILKVQGLNLDCTSVKEVGGRFVGCRKEEFQPAVGSVL